MIYATTAAIIVVLFLVWYALWGRAWLKKKSWTEKFFAAIEPIEIALFKKSETILIGRLIWAGGLLVTFYDAIATFARSMDMTPVTTRIFDALHISPDLRPVAGSAFLAVIGFIINTLRNKTTKPIELVSVPDKVVAETPQLAAAVAAADSAKVEAVAAVEEAKS